MTYKRRDASVAPVTTHDGRAGTGSVLSQVGMRSSGAGIAAGEGARRVNRSSVRPSPSSLSGWSVTIVRSESASALCCGSPEGVPVMSYEVTSRFHNDHTTGRCVLSRDLVKILNTHLPNERGLRILPHTG